jgi:hypothetical protein
MTDTTPAVPRWLLEKEGCTLRQWKARKRSELRAAIKAFESYRMGCAYCNGGDGEVGAIDTALESLKSRISVKRWGR